MIDQVLSDSIHHTNSRLLRRYWADLQNWSCEVEALRSNVQRWSESYIVHLSFSRIPDPKHWKLGILDVRCPWNWHPWHLQYYSLQVCHCAFHTIFHLLLDREKTNVPTETFLRNPSTLQNSNSIHCSFLSQCKSMSFLRVAIFIWEFLLYCVLGKYSTRTQMILLRFQITLRFRMYSRNIVVVLSTFSWPQDVVTSFPRQRTESE